MRQFQPLSDDDAKEAVRLYGELGNKERCAARLGIACSSFRHRLSVAAKRGLTGFRPVLPTFEIKQTSTERDEDGNVKREWIQQRPEAGPVFETPPGHAVKGISAYVDETGHVRAQWIKTREDGPDIIEAVKEAFAGVTGYAALPPAPEHTNAELMSVYPIADAHHGLLSWQPETGENYDLRIGAERLFDCMSALVAQSPPSKEALLLNLGDYLHLNDRTNATPASKNALDVDGRFFKVATTGVDLFRRLIDLALQKHERVTVRCLAGNHDPDSSIILTIALAAFYRNQPRVVILQEPSEFFFHLFGATLIGACHGHRMKPDRMAMAMANMRPQEWGKSTYRWFLFGHIHHETVKEFGDVRCESFQTLSAKDAWNANSGYTSGQSMSSITLHIERGEIGRHRKNIPSAWGSRALDNAA